MQIVRGAHVLIVEAILVQHGTWGQGVRVVTTGRAQPALRRATSLGQEGQVRASSGMGVPTPPEVGSWGQVLEASLGSCGEPSLGAVSGLSMVGSEIGSAPPLPQVPSAPRSPIPSSPIAHGFSSPGPRRQGSLKRVNRECCCSSLSSVQGGREEMLWVSGCLPCAGGPSASGPGSRPCPSGIPLWFICYWFSVSLRSPPLVFSFPLV